MDLAIRRVYRPPPALALTRPPARSSSFHSVSKALHPPPSHQLPPAASFASLSSLTLSSPMCIPCPPPRASPLASLSHLHELLLSLILPYLPLPSIFPLNSVCRSFRLALHHTGTLSNLDLSNPSTPKSLSFLTTALRSSTQSMRTMNLSNCPLPLPDLLHPLLPSFTSLYNLDLSSCPSIQDPTVLEISRHLPSTLRVLSLKFLNLSDASLLPLVASCSILEVLDLTGVALSDAAGVAVGRCLPMLKSLYIRSSLSLTEQTVQAIGDGCKKLEKLTLWDCLKLSDPSAIQSLVHLQALNLHGCFNLSDAAWQSLADESLPQLTMICVAECHRLGDGFVASLARSAPLLRHLNVRYLRKLTDDGLASLISLKHLSTLDVSFCQKITPEALANLIEFGAGLQELRLFGCLQIDTHNMDRCLRRVIEWPVSCLALLDLRNTGVKGGMDWIVGATGNNGDDGGGSDDDDEYGFIVGDEEQGGGDASFASFVPFAEGPDMFFTRATTISFTTQH